MSPEANQQIDRVPGETNTIAPAVPGSGNPTLSEQDAVQAQRSQTQVAMENEILKQRQAAPQRPTIGRVVLVSLTADDAEKINRRRTTGDEISRQMTVGLWPKGAQAHIGNDVTVGDVVPGIIVRVWDDTTVNVQCLLDGTDRFWATQRQLGTDVGSWFWPPRS